MKTLLLRSAFILCLLFLGLKNAEANVSFNDLNYAGNDLPVNTIYSGQTAVAVAGLNISSSRGNDGTTTLTSITFRVNVTPAILAASYANIRLVSSGDPYTPGAFTNSGATPTIAASGGTSATITFSGLSGTFAQTAARNNTYYYLIVDYTANTSGTVNFTTTSLTSSAGNGTTGFGANTFTLKTSSNHGFPAGKNIGIYSITGNTVTTLTSGVQQANVSIPVGNSYLLYYVGDNHLTNQTAVLTSRTPESTPVTATGYLNQGNVVVSFWKNNSTTIPYDVNGGNLPGLNQVGNPYASTIKLSQFYNDNTSTGISPQFWVLDATTGYSGAYISYNASSGATSSTKAGNYIVSGQGFLVQATGTGSGANLTFKEDQKIDYHAITSTSGAPNGALVMDIPSSPGLSNSDAAAKSFAIINPVAAGSVLSGLHLQLSKDSTYYTQTGIYFSTKWSDAYSQIEDAMDLDGATPKVYLSSYSSDGKRLSINELGDYAQGKRIKLYAGATSSGAYTISLADMANIDTVNYNVFLVDKKINDSLDMVHYKSYAFSINNSDTTTYGANRFVLVIKHATVPQYLLTSFRGIKIKAAVQLNWTAMNASDYTGYILQKMDDKGNFNPLYTTQSTKGENSYSYIDPNPIIGDNTYRLLQNDINGKITYSDTVTIKYNHLAQGFAGLTVFPNPSNSIINIIYANTTSTSSIPNFSVDIFNSIGTFMKHESIKSNSWTENISAYKLGVYLLQVKDNSGNLVGQIKFIKNL